MKRIAITFELTEDEVNALAWYETGKVLGKQHQVANAREAIKTVVHLGTVEAVAKWNQHISEVVAQLKY